ncbi:MAG: CoA transferase, partial [Hyphomicrobiales bacterium]|nr:CoA transferase [Hyphomicrobiales bacterium]
FADPEKTRTAVAAIVGQKAAAEWAPLFAEADCCVTIVRDLDAARNDPHFIERGVFSYVTDMPDGTTVPATVVPIAPEFRAANQKSAAPLAAADNDELG